MTMKLKCIISAAAALLASGVAQADMAPFSCASFKPAQIKIEQTQGALNSWIVADQAGLIDVKGVWQRAGISDPDSAKTIAANQAMAQQIANIFRDYGINSHCAPADMYGTPQFANAEYQLFLTSGALPSGRSPHDGNCISFDPTQLSLNQFTESGGSSYGVGFRISQLIDPSSGEVIYETTGDGYQAVRDFLVRNKAKRKCTVISTDPNYYVDVAPEWAPGIAPGPFYYFTK